MKIIPSIALQRSANAPIPTGLESFRVEHYPIITAFCRKIGISTTVNTLVPNQMHVAPGDIVTGMILDTLSGRSPLYHLHRFFEGQDMQLLFGGSLSAEHFNDDAVGRTLDDIQESGTVKIFTSIALKACEVFNIKRESGHFDTTSVNVWGEYLGEPLAGCGPNLCKGFSKDHRPDLNQFVFSLLCVEGNIPVIGRTEDGNSSDGKLNNKELMKVSEWIKEEKVSKDFIYVADCKVVNKENLSQLQAMKFVTRLPANYKEQQRVIEEAVKEDRWEPIGRLAHQRARSNRAVAEYKGCEKEVSLYGKTYRAIVIHSTQHDKRRGKRIEKQIEKEGQEAASKIKVSSQERFACRPDAEKASQQLQALKFGCYQIKAEVVEELVYGSGRAPKNKPRKVKEKRYRLELSLEEKSEEIEQCREQAGCFVLLTNISTEGQGSKNSQEVLKTYKDQHGVETNFRFLKDPLLVNDLFLKKPERIEALGLILLLSLLVCNLIQRVLREYVVENETKICGWNNLPTDKPTTYMLSWIFKGISIFKLGNHRKLVQPLSEEQLQYLQALKLSIDIFTLPP